ncbi:MAG: DUF503 domain-containing protein [Candidatus Tectomicrobia bacterium]|nr:DUF503 domain-containing protein [Candidatus Tectomicrobia bacterium]
MIVGVCTIELRLHENRSLKGKRQVLKSITSRVKNNFNVAIAEVDFQDKWQRALLGVAVVSTAQDHANGILSKVVNFVDSMHLAELLDYEIEFW